MDTTFKYLHTLNELAMETRRRLQVNVSEALALEALAYRLEYLLSR